MPKKNKVFKRQQETNMQEDTGKTLTSGDETLDLEKEEIEKDKVAPTEEIEEVEEEAEEIEEIDENDSDYKEMRVALDFLDIDNKVVIDREQEDGDVELYQRTKDKDILNRVYRNRIPTLQFWANKNFYPGLTTSVEDLFGDLSLVFIKAIEKYNKGRGSFNTCLFTFLLNRIKNMKNSQHAKKRISEEYDGPLSSMVLSLDFAYNDKDGANVTLKDILPAALEENEESMSFKEIITLLSKNDPILKDFFNKISEGHSLASLLKQSKIRTGEIQINLSQYDSLKKRRNKILVKNLLIEKGIVDGEFTMVDYSLGCLKVFYTIELKKTPEFVAISRAVRELRNHKEYYIARLKGEL